MIQVFRETLYFPTSLEIAPSIDLLNSGGAAVVWTETRGQNNIVKRNIFNTPEETRTGALDVNNLFPSFGLFNTSVAALAGGGFVVVWQSGDPAGALGDIRFRVFDEIGATQPDSQVLAHPDTAGIQSYPTVVATEHGGFVIAWTDQSGTRDDPGTGSFAREFHASGILVDEPFLLNTSTIGDQTAPQLAFGEGRLAAVWNSFSDSAAVLVDSPFFQVFDMQPETIAQGLPDGFAPPDLLSQLSLDDGSSISVRAVPVGRLFTDWFYDHRDADGEILYSQQLINTRGASHMVLNADDIISVSLELLSRTTPSTLLHDPASLSPLPYFQLERLRSTSQRVGRAPRTGSTTGSGWRITSSRVSCLENGLGWLTLAGV